MIAHFLGGAKSAPIISSQDQQFHMVDGKRLQVNASAPRYQRSL
jgi:hypothetical protein